MRAINASNNRAASNGGAGRPAVAARLAVPRFTAGVSGAVMRTTRSCPTNCRSSVSRRKRKASRQRRLIALRRAADASWRLGITSPRRHFCHCGRCTDSHEQACIAKGPRRMSAGAFSTSVKRAGESSRAARGNPPAGSVASPAGPPRLPSDATQTARRWRPLARRARITLRPPRVRMRTRKPWVRLRRTTEGW